MNFYHVLITQFNLRNFPKSSNASNEQWLNWTRNRIELFKKYCLPSVVNQTTRNFKWLIYFDTATPPEFSPFIGELTKYDFIEVCYCDGSERFFNNYFNEVIQRIPNGCQWVLSSRLDNDDMLHKDAIKTIQENFVEKQNFIISLASGYVLDIDRNVLAHYFYSMSPFISLIESVNANPIGIFARPHTQWPTLKLSVLKECYLHFFKPQKRLSIFILSRPLWIQVFHGGNVANSFYRGLPVLSSVNLTDFGMDIITKKMKIKELFKFSNYVLWKRYFKASVVRAIINK
ncbi:MAG: glycosyltransferase [Cyclobacteriaceae bacterium]